MTLRNGYSVMFIGGADTEGALSKLKLKRIRYEKKLLNSKPGNWQKIAEMATSPTTRAVVMKIVPSDVVRFARPDYKAASEAVLDAIAAKQCLVLAYDELITGTSTGLWSGGDKHRRSDPTSAECVELFTRFDHRNITVTPYKNLAELSVVVGAFIEDHDQDLLFRAYVPADRIYSDEIDQVLDLFSDWLRRSVGVSIRRDGYRTSRGSVHEFYGDGTLPKAQLPGRFAEFSDFLEECVQHPDRATRALQQKGLESATALELVEKYAKRTRRVLTDMRHEFERKMLQLRQAAEVDVLDRLELVSGETEAGTKYPLPADVLQPDAVSNVINVNLHQNVIAQAGATVAGVVAGGGGLSLEAQQLLELIAEKASSLGEDVNELATAVHEVEDDYAPDDARLNSKQRLKAFLFRVAGHGERIGAELLKSYLEGRLP
jgi:hypothetical protein